ncbi:lysoplasmalogenase [Paenibacillus sp. strain BS8-2]
MKQNGLLLVIGISAIIHLATLSLGIEWLNWLFKLLPMVLIIGLAFASRVKGTGNDGAVYRGLIVTGLVFSIGGDTLLLLPDDPWFVFGLGSFLIGHLFYVAAMATRWLNSTKSQEKTAKSKQEGFAIGFTAGIMIIAYSITMGSRFYESIMADESQSGLWIPVVIYIAVIGAMGWTAIMSRNVVAICGALLFMASDSILAWNKFVGEVPMSGVLIMSTYFAAQLLIASSIANGRGSRGFEVTTK